MKTYQNEATPDMEALLTVLAMAMMASHPDFDSERFSALLLAASMPDSGLERPTGEMLARIATSTCEWAQAQRRQAELEAPGGDGDVTLH
jgi:hypothetical protein